MTLRRCVELFARPHLTAVVLAAAIALIGAPLACWPQFVDEMEQLNVATALELKWDGIRLVPNLQGAPRLLKPPLVPWITALSIRESTVQLMSRADASPRERGYRQLAWDVRWPMMLASFLLLLSVYGLGSTAFGPRVGLLSLVICGSTVLFMRYMRWSTYDVPLALLVVMCNYFLARWILNGDRWVGAIGAAIALALAIMSKGPVALVQTVLPAIVFVACCRWRDLRAGAALPLVVAVALCLALVMPWVLFAAKLAPDVWRLWYGEMARTRVPGRANGDWYGYIVMLRLCLPWTGWLIAGGVMGFAAMRQRQGKDQAALMLLMVLVPVIVMSFARERKGHYLLPLIGPTAVLCGVALSDFLRAGRSWGFVGTLLGSAHWLALAALGVTAAVRQANFARNLHVNPSPFLLVVGILSLAFVASGVIMQRRWRAAIVLATVCVMCVVRIGEDTAVRAQRGALRDLAESIWQTAADSAVCMTMPNFAREAQRQYAVELEIYLNRVVRYVSSPDDAAGANAVLVVVSAHAGAHAHVPPGWNRVTRHVALRRSFELLVPAKPQELTARP